LSIFGVDRETAWRAAELRAVHRLQPAAALQIATCLQHGANAFFTNDRILKRVTELRVLFLNDFL
jgi:predicted nucleic acid-binding protein